jgi:acyl-coenzyme A thioesterase PaaI-like protein
MEEQLTAMKAKYTEVLAAEETEARAKAQHETDAVAVAEAEKEAETVYARVSALKAKLGR